MENRETYNGKTPFYMTYPMQNLYLAEMEYEKDMERMKEMYPKEISELQKMIEKRADEMEYEGSRIYDENPDREMLREEAIKIFEEFLMWLEELSQMQPMPPMEPMPPMAPIQPMPPTKPILPMPGRFMLNPPREWGEIMLPNSSGNLSGMESAEKPLEQAQVYGGRDDRRCGDNPWLCNLTEVLFQNEIYRRRCRQRRCRRWW